MDINEKHAVISIQDHLSSHGWNLTDFNPMSKDYYVWTGSGACRFKDTDFVMFDGDPVVTNTKTIVFSYPQEPSLQKQASKQQ